MDWIVVFCLILSFIVGILFTLGIQLFIARAALSQFRSRAGTISRDKYQAQESDLMALIQESAEAFKKAKEEGMDIKEFGVKVMPGIVMRHPVSAMKFGKRLLDLLQQGNLF